MFTKTDKLVRPGSLRCLQAIDRLKDYHLLSTWRGPGDVELVRYTVGKTKLVSIDDGTNWYRCAWEGPKMTWLAYLEAKEKRRLADLQCANCGEPAREGSRFCSDECEQERQAAAAYMRRLNGLVAKVLTKHH